MTKIDITKPLEAVETATGRVVPLTFSRLASDPRYPGQFYTTDAPCNSTSNTMWSLTGEDRCYAKKWTIRNVESKMIDTTKPLRLVGTHEPVTFIKKDQKHLVIKLPPSMDSPHARRYFHHNGVRDNDQGEKFHGLVIENVPEAKLALDLTRPMQMRDGTKVTCLSSAATGDNPLVFQTDGTDIIFARPLDGRALPDQDLPIDIVNVDFETSDLYLIVPSGGICKKSDGGGALDKGLRINIKRTNGKVTGVELVEAGPNA